MVLHGPIPTFTPLGIKINSEKKGKHFLLKGWLKRTEENIISPTKENCL